MYLQKNNGNKGKKDKILEKYNYFYFSMINYYIKIAKL